MGIKTVMNARAIVFIALGKNKAETVARAFEGEITPEVPASILQLHPFVKVYLDHDAASLLKSSFNNRITSVGQVPPLLRNGCLRVPEKREGCHSNG